MLNHLILANLLRPNTFSKANDIYLKDVEKGIKNEKDAKDYLISLNMFLYTYFLMEFNKDLEDFTLKNYDYIKKENDFDLLIEFGEKILKGYNDKFTHALKENNDELIEKVLEYINENINDSFSDKLNLQNISNIFHISKNYLCHLFKVQTGYRFGEYVNIQKVNKAKKLIEEGKKTFEFISFECGFSSQSHFSTTFKKYTGLTPNEYKKSISA